MCGSPHTYTICSMLALAVMFVFVPTYKIAYFMKLYCGRISTVGKSHSTNTIAAGHLSSPSSHSVVRGFFSAEISVRLFRIQSIFYPENFVIFRSIVVEHSDTEVCCFIFEK